MSSDIYTPSLSMSNLQNPAETEEISAVDLVVLAQIDSPTQAHLMRNLLEQAGVPVYMFDGNMLQMDMLLTPALGGVRLRVPHAFLLQGQEVLAQYESGALDLEPDTQCTPVPQSTSPFWQSLVAVSFCVVLALMFFLALLGH